MELSWILLAQLFTLGCIIYWYVAKKYSYWSSRNVPGPKPMFLVGNTLEIVLDEPNNVELRWTKEHGKMYGIYTILEPMLTVTDPELVKQIMVKDFDKFINRNKSYVEHKVWDESLFQLGDDKWKAVRSITSPTFTSGKLRGMLPLMNRTVDKLMQYLDKVSAGSDKVMDAKEVIGGFTMDTIALTSFATETNANDDRSKKNIFLENAKKFFDFNSLKIMAIVMLPKFFLRLFNLRLFFNQKSFDYFAVLTRQILKQRYEEKQTIKRNDLVQLLMDASIDEKELLNTNYDKMAVLEEYESEDKPDTQIDNSSNSSTSRRKLTETEIVAQCILFLLAGYETTAATVTYLLYELAINQDIQDRLCEEVSQALDSIEDTNSREYFDTIINGIPLLEAAIKETLRKYPPVTRVERRVGVDGYKLGGVELQKNLSVQVSVYSVHHSEENYPNPSRFDPDRFMPENRHLLVPYTYLPFGTGPRNCLGMRFAYQEIKLLLVRILTRYRFEPTANTPIPLTFKKGQAFLSIDTLPISVSRRE